jgi:hypothetical protein
MEIQKLNFTPFCILAMLRSIFIRSERISLCALPLPWVQNPRVGWVNKSCSVAQ